MLLTVVVGAKAAVTGKAYLNLSNAWIDASESTAEVANSKDATTGAVVLNWNTKVAWNLNDIGIGKNISGYKTLVVNLSSAADQDLYIYLNDGGTFYPLTSLSLTTLSKGETSISIDLASLTHTGLGDGNDKGDGSTIDLTNVNTIGIFNQNGSYARTSFTIESVYLAPAYDYVNEIPAKSNVTLSGLTTIFDWGTKSTENENVSLNLTVDAANNKVTTTKGNDNSYGINTYVAYDGLDYDVEDYDKLVVKANATASGFFIRLDDVGSYGNYQTAVETTGEDATITIDLASLATNNDNTLNGLAQDARTISKIKRIGVYTMSAGEFTFKEIYFERSNGAKYYLVRNNTSANKYGTICLPFAASIPTNAKVYTIAGKDANNTKIYLTEATSIVAGKAYIFQSSDANDVTFTKTGTDANIEAPSNTDAALVGNFAAATITGSENVYILNNNVWKNVSATGAATTSRAYRAYLDLSKVSETTGSSAKSMAVGNGTVTGINAVENAEASVNSQNVYNLSGQRVGSGYKGVVIKNGKKYIVK